MSAMLERARRAQALQAIQGAADEAAALGVIGRALDDTLAGLTTGEERFRLYRTVRSLAVRATPKRTSLRKDDVMGAIACFWLVVVSTIPAALPFLFMDNAWQRCGFRISCSSACCSSSATCGADTRTPTAGSPAWCFWSSDSSWWPSPSPSEADPAGRRES